MKKLIFTLTILIAVPFVPAQTYDWKIASRARDDESAVRINWQGQSYLTDRFLSTPFAEMRAAYIFSSPTSSARSAASSLGQRSFAHSVGQSSTRRIPLIRNATKNGSTTTQEGNTIYFQAVNVVDPSSKKLLAGLKQLEYQCSPNSARIAVNLQFSSGHSDRINVSCLALIKPRIIVMEDRSEPS